MPTICIFYGIVIRMFFRDHAPPHFHVEYSEHLCRQHRQPNRIEPLE